MPPNSIWFWSNFSSTNNMIFNFQESFGLDSSN
jgi:hypothetical protein